MNDNPKQYDDEPKQLDFEAEEIEWKKGDRVFWVRFSLLLPVCVVIVRSKAHYRMKRITRQHKTRQEKL